MLDFDHTSSGDFPIEWSSDRDRPVTLSEWNAWCRSVDGPVVTLRARGNRLPPAAARALRGIPAGALLELDLSRNQLGDTGAMLLAEWLPPQLHVLDLSHNWIRASGGRALFNAFRGNTQLRVLRLANNRTLAQGIVLPPSLIELDIGNNGLGPVGMERICGQMPPALEVLNVRANSIREVGAMELAGAMPATLHSLDVSRNRISPFGIAALLDALPDGIERLCVRGSHIARHEVPPRALTHCDISQCDAAETVYVALLNSTPTLRELTLSGSIRTSIASSLGGLRSLRKLSIVHAYLDGAASIDALGLAIESLPLEELEISMHSVGNLGVERIAPRLPGTLKSLLLHNTWLGDGGAAAIAAAALDNLEMLLISGINWFAEDKWREILPPKLRALTLEFRNTPATRDQNAMFGALAERGSRIQFFSLRSENSASHIVPETAFAHALGGMPHLRALHLSSFRFAEDAAEVLDQVPLAELQVLHVYETHGYRFESFPWSRIPESLRVLRIPRVSEAMFTAIVDSSIASLTISAEDATIPVPALLPRLLSQLCKFEIVSLDLNRTVMSMLQSGLSFQSLAFFNVFYESDEMHAATLQSLWDAGRGPHGAFEAITEHHPWLANANVYALEEELQHETCTCTATPHLLVWKHRANEGLHQAPSVIAPLRIRCRRGVPLAWPSMEPPSDSDSSSESSGLGGESVELEVSAARMMTLFPGAAARFGSYLWDWSDIGVPVEAIQPLIDLANGSTLALTEEMIPLVANACAWMGAVRLIWLELDELCLGVFESHSGKTELSLYTAIRLVNALSSEAAARLTRSLGTHSR